MQNISIFRKLQLILVLGTVSSAFSPEAIGLSVLENYRSLSGTYMNEHNEIFSTDIMIADDEGTAIIHVQDKVNPFSITVKDHKGDEFKNLQNNVCMFKCYWTDQTSDITCYKMFRPNSADVPKHLRDACAHNEIIGLTLTSCSPAEEVAPKVTMKTCKKCYDVTYKEKILKRECCSYKKQGYRKICKRHCHKIEFVTKKKEVCKETLSAFC